MKAETFLQNTLLGMDCVQLGRLVLNARNPQQDYHDFPNAPTQFSVNPQRNFQEIVNLSKHSKIRSHLTSLLSVSYDNRKERCITLKASVAKTYRLLNSGTWFKEACRDGTRHTWLEDAIRDSKDVYLVIGFHTIIDAEIAQGISNGGSIGGSVELHSTMVNALVSGVGALSLGARSTLSTNNQSRRFFNAPGEQIYAIQYRKLVFKWFSRRSIHTTSLEPENRWKTARSKHLRKLPIEWEYEEEDHPEPEVCEEPGDEDCGPEEKDSEVEEYGHEEEREAAKKLRMEAEGKASEVIKPERNTEEAEKRPILTRLKRMRKKLYIEEEEERREREEMERAENMLEEELVEMDVQYAIDELAVEDDDDTEEFIF